MKEKMPWSWRWPEEGQPTDQLLAEVGERIQSPYDRVPPPISYPGTPLGIPASFNGTVMVALNQQLNNIGIHTLGSTLDGSWKPALGEGGFEGVQALEREVIWMIASMLGGSPDTIHGCFTSGGTDANLFGLWLGRQWLRDQVPGGDGKDIMLLQTCLTHYSVEKSFDILDCLGGKADIRIDANMRMRTDFLESSLSDSVRAGRRRFIVVPTAGTTLTGSVDPIADISSVVERFNASHPHAKAYLHVDAAFGGFTIPFTNDSRHIGFQNPGVQSITVDCHKMGQLPYPGGIILFRQSLLGLLPRKVEYVDGHNYDTVLGSRPALPAILAWLLYRSSGIAGQREYVGRCLAGRDRLIGLLLNRFPQASNLRSRSPIWLLPSDPYVNILPLACNERSINAGSLIKHPTLKDYHLRSERIPAHHSPTGRTISVFKIVVMPHTLPHLERFVADLAAAAGA